MSSFAVQKKKLSKVYPHPNAFIMFWYIDPGYPTFETFEDARRAAWEAGIVIKVGN